MIDADTILKMIENVDPADRDKLDEIDQTVCDYLGKLARPLPRYTRSRDALKAIRPAGWQFELVWISKQECIGYNGHDKYLARLVHADTTKQAVYYHHRHSEELAELHAIIQVIAYERAQGGAA
jgi:hypothetical protein